MEAESSRKRKKEGSSGGGDTFGDIMKCVNAAEVISMSNKEIRALVMVRELCNSIANKDRKLPTDGDVSRALKNGTKYGVEVCKNIGDQLSTVGFEGFNDHETQTLERILKTARVIVELGGTRRRPKLETNAKDKDGTTTDHAAHVEEGTAIATATGTDIGNHTPQLKYSSSPIIEMKTEIIDVDTEGNTTNAAVETSLRLIQSQGRALTVTSKKFQEDETIEMIPRT